MSFEKSGRNPKMNRRDGRQGTPHHPLLMSAAPHCSHAPLQDWTVAWPNPHLLEEGGSTLLAGEVDCRALIKCLNGQVWVVPRWSVADIVPALGGFQDDPDTQMGTGMDGQLGTKRKQNVKSDSVCVHILIR